MTAAQRPRQAPLPVRASSCPGPVPVYRPSPAAAMSYNYVVTAQKPTAVNGCVTGTGGGEGGGGGGGGACAAVGVMEGYGTLRGRGDTEVPGGLKGH